MDPLQATGAMPGPGATPGQAAAAPTTTPPSSGATPPAGTTPPAAAQPPATGDDAALGEAGQRAIAAERAAAKAANDRAKAAEDELAKLKEAGQSDQDKALAQAKREASAEERTKWQAHIRTTEIRSQLRAAGLTNEKSLELAVAAPSLTRLKVTDEGSVEGIADAIAAFKKDHAEMFGAPAAPAPGGAWGGSEGGGTGKKPANLEEAVAATYDKR